VYVHVRVYETISQPKSGLIKNQAANTHAHTPNINQKECILLELLSLHELGIRCLKKKKYSSRKNRKD